MDRDEIRRRLLLRIFGDPATLALGVGGGMVLLAAPLFGLVSAIPIFLGIAGLSSAAGIVSVRALLWKEKITRELIEEFEQEEAQRRTEALDALHRRLEYDNDPRTEALLNDLRALFAAVDEDDKWRARVNVVAAADILKGISELFDACVGNLERTLQIHATASKLATRSAGEPLRQEREQIIDDVAASVTRLGQLVTELRVIGTSAEEGEPELGKIRSQLDTNLAAIRATKRQMENQ